MTCQEQENNCDFLLSYDWEVRGLTRGNSDFILLLFFEGSDS